MHRRWMVAVVLVVGLVVGLTAGAEGAGGATNAPSPVSGLLFRSLDGSGNNPFRPTLGQAGTNYSRVAPAHYANGFSSFTDVPNAR